MLLTILGTHNGMLDFRREAADLASSLADASGKVALVLNGIIIPERQVAEGVLIASTSGIWLELAKALSRDWTQAYGIPPRKWEEIIAVGFKRWGYDEVILTHRSGDHGCDVIATKKGLGSMKVLGEVKAYKPGHLVDYTEIRALLGVVGNDRAASKGLIATTSDFPPLLANDPISAAIPTRLELMNGNQLREWLTELAASDPFEEEGRDDA